MPLARNKIIINGGSGGSNDVIIHGNSKGIRKAYEVAEFVADEIEGMDLLKEPEAIVFKEKMEKLCNVYHPAQQDFQKAQLEHQRGILDLVEEMRIYVDGKILHP